MALSVVNSTVSLCVLGAASTSLYFWGRDLHRFTQWLMAFEGLFIGQLALYVLACYVVDRWADRSTRFARWMILAAIVCFAASNRAVLIPQRPFLSLDVYRYVWDGHVQRAGINPYRYVPESDELIHLRDNKVYPNINQEDKRWYSPYPPIAQLVFAAVARIAPLSVTAFKAAITSFDLITTILLMIVLARSGIDPARAIIFAWHPLIIFEGAHSGHVEAVYVSFLVLALFAWSSSKRSLSGIPLAMAALVKFYPALVLPAFLRLKSERTGSSESNVSSLFRAAGGILHKHNLIILAGFGTTVLLAYAVYWGAASTSFWFLRGYVAQEGFVEGGARYFLLESVRKVVWVPTIVFLVFGAACVIVVAFRQLLRATTVTDVARSCLALIGTYLLITTPRYAWYYVWLVPFLCFEPRISWFYLSCSAALLYLVWYTPLLYPGIPAWLGLSVYLPTIAWLVLEQLRSRRLVKGSLE